MHIQTNNTINHHGIQRTHRTTPSYEAASSSMSSHLYKTRSGIPPQYRRSMEDEAHPLPTGWMRQYDPKTHHQFFVDERASPPRSIWHHPYHDEQYLSSLSSSERSKIEGLHREPSHADIVAESSEDDTHHHDQPLPPREEHPKGAKKLGRKMKDKLTHTTHAQRVHQRQQREEEEEVPTPNTAPSVSLGRKLRRQDNRNCWVRIEMGKRCLWNRPHRGRMGMGLIRMDRACMDIRMRGF
jgi:hypothetical protein